MGIYKEKRENTRNNLIDAFWKLYEKENIDRIKVKDITDKAGYNRATFYVHFKDVYDILQCIEDKLLESFDYEQIDIDNLNQKDRLIQSINIFSSNERYFRVLLSSKGDPHFVEKCKKILRDHFYSFSNNDDNHIEQNTDLITEYIIGGLLNCILYWFEVKPYSYEELFDKLYKLIITCQQNI